MEGRGGGVDVAQPEAFYRLLVCGHSSQGGGLERGIGVGGGSQGTDEVGVLGLGRGLHLTLVPPLATRVEQVTSPGLW